MTVDVSCPVPDGAQFDAGQWTYDGVVIATAPTEDSACAAVTVAVGPPPTLPDTGLEHSIALTGVLLILLGWMLRVLRRLP